VNAEHRSVAKIVHAALLAVALGLFVYHASLYWAWTEDDAFISFRYAQNLAAGNGLVFNPGERVEGYSNLSWVLLAAGALRAGLDPTTVAKSVGLACGALAVLLAWLLARRLTPQPGPTALLAPFYLAISPVLVQHSASGLETSLFAVLVMGGVLLTAAGEGFVLRALRVLVLLLLAVTRPEGPAVAALLLLIGPFTRGSARRRRAWTEAVVFGVLFGTYFIWRWSYFGAPFPNTFYAKTRGGLHGIIDGAQYTLDFLRDAGGPLLVSLAAVPMIVGRTRPVMVPALVVLAFYFGFVMISGGDWMFHYRFFAHVLPLLAATIAAGLDVVLSLPRPGKARTAAAYALVAIVLLATHMSLGNTELRIARIVLPALQRHNYLSQNYEELGRWFAENTPPDASIAISDVGAVGYFSQRTIIDMFGLIDPHIGRLRGRMHYKADPSYVLGRHPDYIVLVSLSDAGEGYSFQRIPDYAMNGKPEFHEHYELLRTVPQYWQDEFVLVYHRRD
jgi:hypothetical protein